MDETDRLRLDYKLAGVVPVHQVAGPALVYGAALAASRLLRCQEGHAASAPA